MERVPTSSGMPLLRQEQETIQDLLFSYVLAREVWASTLSFSGKMAWMPEVDSALME